MFSFVFDLFFLSCVGREGTQCRRLKQAKIHEKEGFGFFFFFAVTEIQQ